MKQPSYKNPRYNETVKYQEILKNKVVIRPIEKEVRYIGGADVSCNLYGKNFWGGLVVCDIENNFELVDSSVAGMEVDFPYIPGLLAFREVPVLLNAFKGLEKIPDVLIVDGQGIAHPRGVGSASHMGIEIGIPTIGCAKNRLCGEAASPTKERGSRSLIKLDGKIIGAALRTRAGVKPVWVSPGHMIDLESSLDIVMRCSPRYRIPEPVRRAHELVNNARRNSKVK